MELKDCAGSGAEASRAGITSTSGPNSVGCICGSLSVVLSTVHVSCAGLLGGPCHRISAVCCADGHMFRWDGAVEALWRGALQALLPPCRAREDHSPRQIKVPPHPAVVQCGDQFSSALVCVSVRGFECVRGSEACRALHWPPVLVLFVRRARSRT